MQLADAGKAACRQDGAFQRQLRRQQCCDLRSCWAGAGLVVQDRGAAVLQKIDAVGDAGQGEIAAGRGEDAGARISRCDAAMPSRALAFEFDEASAPRSRKRGRHTASAALGMPASANTSSAMAISCATASSGKRAGIALR